MDEFKKYWFIFLIGIIIRLIIAATSYHPDVKILSYSQSVFLRQLSLNPYSFNANLDDENLKKLYGGEKADDLPLQYLLPLPMQAILRVFVDSTAEEIFLTDTSRIYGDIRLSIYLLVLKMPVIVFDILLALVLMRFVDGVKKRIVAALWLLNPFTIWTTAAIGQVDIMPTFFMLLSLYFFRSRKFSGSALSLGVAAALKSFGFLLAPLFIFAIKDNSRRIQFLTLFLLPYLVSVAPYIMDSNFRTNALFAPQMDKIFYAKIGLSGGEAISLNVLILVFLYLLYIKKERTYQDILNFTGAILLCILAFTHFHIQWFLWVIPILILWVIKKGRQSFLPVGLSLISLTGMLFLFEASLQVQLFSPLLPELKDAYSITQIIGSERARFLRDIIASIFAASSIYIAWEFLKNGD